MNNELSVAEVADRHRRRFALGLLGIGIMYGLRAISHLTNPELGTYLNRAGDVLAIAVVLAIIPALIWKMRRLPRGQRHLYFSEEGFVAETMNRAHLASWATTFFTLVGLEILADEIGPFPAEFYLQIGLAVMLCVLGGAFIALNQAADEPEPELSPGA